MDWILYVSVVPDLLSKPQKPKTAKCCLKSFSYPKNETFFWQMFANVTNKHILTDLNKSKLSSTLEICE